METKTKVNIWTAITVVLFPTLIFGIGLIFLILTESLDDSSFSMALKITSPAVWFTSAFLAVMIPSFYFRTVITEDIEKRVSLIFILVLAGIYLIEFNFGFSGEFLDYIRVKFVIEIKRTLLILVQYLSSGAGIWLAFHLIDKRVKNSKEKIRK